MKSFLIYEFSKCKNLNLMMFSCVALLIFSSSCFFGGISLPYKKFSVLEKIQKSGNIRVITRKSPTIYNIDKNNKSGFEYDLVTAFAKSLNVKVTFITKNSNREILEALELGQGDIAAANIVQSKSTSNRFIFGPGYLESSQLLVCRRGGFIPRSLSDITKVSITVPNEGYYLDTMKNLKKINKNVEWLISSQSAEYLLKKVWKKEFGCTLADSNILAVNQRYFPELEAAFKVANNVKYSWVLNRNSTSLQAYVSNWFNTKQTDEHVSIISDRYYGHIKNFDYVEIKKYSKRITNRLPQFKNEFVKAGNKHNIDWRLLAAQSYQESHWDPVAKSPTGVRGLMMLTKVTAKSLGIKNRLDPIRSIHGGAEYLAKILEYLPSDIAEHDRLWFALAAYNVGMGHIHDARYLARQLGKNMSSWKDIQNVLPLLSKKKYHTKLKHGYARGYEPVLYVKRIREYYDLLTKYKIT